MAGCPKAVKAGCPKMMDNYSMFNFCLKWTSEGITFALKVRAIREWKVEDAARRAY